MARTKAGLIVPDDLVQMEPPSRDRIVEAANRATAALMSGGFTAEDVRAVGRVMMRNAKRIEKRRGA